MRPGSGPFIFILIVAIVVSVWTTIDSYKHPISSAKPPEGIGGLFQILFQDIRFNFFAVRKFVSAIYFLLVMFSVAFTITGILYFLYIALFSEMNDWLMIRLAGCIFVPPVAIVVSRFLLESFIAVIKIAENTSAMASESSRVKITGS